MTRADMILKHEDQEVRVSLHGGRIVAYIVRGEEIIAGTQSPHGPFAYRSALLAPWPNRITGGRWSWQGQELQLEVNQPETSSALHGLVVHADFALVEGSERSCTVVHDLQPTPGYPFRLKIEATYALSAGGLACALVARNRGDQPVPVGLGVHPYIAAPRLVDDLVLTLPARRLLVTDDEWREVERRVVAGTDDDFRSGRRLGHRDIDAAFTDLERAEDGRVHAALARPGGRTVRVWGGTTCRWFVVYTGHTLAPDEWRRSMCIEPMTCGPNAFVNGEVDLVEPGEDLRLDWGVCLESPLS